MPAASILPPHSQRADRKRIVLRGSAPRFRFGQSASREPRWLQRKKIPEGGARQQALNGLFGGSASRDPASLLAHAQMLPAGDTRAAALNEGLTQWVYRDPVAASAWMNKRGPGADLDAGAVAVATASVLVERRPEIAASWAESITDPELRANTQLDLLRQWAGRDVEGALEYVNHATTLAPETRALALGLLQPAP